MNTILKITTAYGAVITNELTQVLVEYIDNSIVIHSDNGLDISIPESECEMIETETADIYKLPDGMDITITYP